MAELQTAEELIEEWRSRRASDYSWASLGRREIAGGGLHGEETLQDYWRRDPESGAVRNDDQLRELGELIQGPDEKLWHIVHLPDRIADHGKTEKASFGWEAWRRITTIVASRLQHAEKTLIDDASTRSTRTRSAREGREAPREGRALLDGAVLRDIPDLPASAPIHARFRAVQFLWGANFDNRVFGSPVTFEDVCFSRFAWFDNAVFEEEVNFATAVFAGDGLFNGAEFKKRVSYYAIKAAHDLRFAKTTPNGVAKATQFRDVANFGRAAIRGLADFGAAEFSGEANFSQAEMSRLSCGRAKFKGANFSSIAVSDSLDMSNAEFAKDAGAANFNEAKVEGEASFERAKLLDGGAFRGARFAKLADLTQIEIAKSADFQDVKFLSNASFTSAKLENPSFYSAFFAQDMGFESAVLKGKLNFPACECESIVWFQSANFSEAESIRFQGAKFKGPAVFNGVVWPKTAECFQFAFIDVGFPRLATFLDGVEEFHAFAAFDGAQFNGGARFSTKVVEEDACFNRAVNCAKEGAKRAVLRDQNRERVGLFDFRLRSDIAKQTDVMLACLQRGYRAVKNAAENERDRVAEQRFYRCELISRNLQSTTSNAERIFSLLYGLSSNYGGSSKLPLFWIFVFWILFAGLYQTWGGFSGASAVVGADLLTSWAEAAKLSAHAIFRPFAIWADTFPAGGWQRELLDGGGSGQGLAVRIVASAQSVLALALFFLTALAVRRRFQIN
ncbi:MAG: pentapeptide repeat-containing protein [Hyphomonadaceae bacterium]